MSSKDVEWLGSSLDDLRKFPEEMMRDAGYQLNRVQEGEEPGDWRPMPTVGSGVCEIRLSDRDGWYRVFYVASLGDVVYVLHAFEKDTKKTSKSDLSIGKERYKEAIRRRDAQSKALAKGSKGHGKKN